MWRTGTCTIRDPGHRSTMTTEELKLVGETCKPVHVNTLLSKRSTVEILSIPKNYLKGVKDKIQMTQKVVILLFVIILVKGAAKLTKHSKHMNVIVEPIVGY